MSGALGIAGRPDHGDQRIETKQFNLARPETRNPRLGNAKQLAASTGSALFGRYCHTFAGGPYLRDQ